MRRRGDGWDLPPRGARWHVLALAWLLLSPAAHGNEAEAQGPRAQSGTGALRGRVTSDGRPVLGAALFALSGGTTTSDENGYFVLPELPAGTLYVVAALPGFNSRSALVEIVAGGIVEQPFELEANVLGGSAAPLRTLVTGVVLDEESGAPILDATISAQTIEGEARAPVDAGGHYAIGPFGGSDVELTAEAPGYAAARVVAPIASADGLANFALRRSQ